MAGRLGWQPLPAYVPPALPLALPGLPLNLHLLASLAMLATCPAALYCLLPMLFKLSAIALILGFPTDAAAQARRRAAFAVP